MCCGGVLRSAGQWEHTFLTVSPSSPTFTRRPLPSLARLWAVPSSDSSDWSVYDASRSFGARTARRVLMRSIWSCSCPNWTAAPDGCASCGPAATTSGEDEGGRWGWGTPRSTSAMQWFGLGGGGGGVVHALGGGGGEGAGSKKGAGSAPPAPPSLSFFLGGGRHQM